jgi:hypothetical protein
MWIKTKPHLMLLRQERMAFCLLVTVAIGISLGSLILPGIDKGALAQEFEKNQTEGTLVRIEGTVDELSWTKTGGHLSARIAGTSVFMPAGVAENLALREGDRVLVYGIVQTYRGEKEIVVQDAGDVEIIETADGY